MRRSNKGRRAVSEIVGVLIILAAVVTIGVLVFSLASGGLSSLSQGYALSMTGKARAASEKFMVEQAAFDTTGVLAIDGTSTNQAVGSSGSIGTALTTTSGNDVIVAYVSPANSGSSAPPSVSGISGGGLTWNHRVTTAAETYSQPYVPITLTNSQTSATPNPFQQRIVWNPSTYAANEAADLGNIRFCADSACTSILFAWLESCTPSCGTSATSATAWVRLTSAIAPSGGTLTIYMEFEAATVTFDDNFWGEAPTISGAYGQFDNGAKVFTFYDDFEGSSLSGVWTTVATSGGSVTVNNGATFSTVAKADYAFVESPVQAFPQVAESLMVSSSGKCNPLLGVATSSSTNNYIALYNGYSMDVAGTTQTLAAQAAGGGTSVASNGAESFNPGIWQVTWSATGAESASDGASPLSGSDNSLTIANYGAYVGTSKAGTCTAVVVDWVRMRAFPPSAVMPSSSLGSVGTAMTTFDLEEWYATASSPLSAATMTATLSAPDTESTWIAVFGISGANPFSPFDSDGSVPAVSSGTSPSTTISTANPNDMLLYGCAAGLGGMGSGFMTVFANALIPAPNEFVGYDTVSATQSSLATSCGTNSYGAEVTDAVVASPSGADLYVRNVGSTPVTLVSVYVTDVTSNSFLSQTPVSTTVNVGSFAEVSHFTLQLPVQSGHKYSFTVSSSLGNSITYGAGMN